MSIADSTSKTKRPSFSSRSHSSYTDQQHGAPAGDDSPFIRPHSPSPPPTPPHRPSLDVLKNMGSVRSFPLMHCPWCIFELDSYLSVYDALADACRDTGTDTGDSSISMD